MGARILPAIGRWGRKQRCGEGNGEFSIKVTAGEGR